MTLTWPRAPVNKEDFIEKIERGWRQFRTAVERIGELGMGRRTAYGWYLKDVVAHVAAWEGDLANQLHRLMHESDYRAPTGPEIDAFNAEAIRWRRAVTPAELVAELDRAHDRLLDVVRKMSPSELANQRVVDFFASRTFGHYQEHANDFGEHGWDWRK